MSNTSDTGFFFLNSDIIDGENIWKDIIRQNGQTADQIFADGTTKQISYFTHHKRLNTADTRKVLSYLLAHRFGFYHNGEISKQLELISIPIIIHEYINSRDYKVLQYIYNADKCTDYVFMMNKHFETMMPSEAWKLSLNAWDVNFTKFIYRDILSKIPWELRKKAAARAFTPNKKFTNMLKLMDQNSEKFKYYDNKLDLLQHMFKL